MLSADVIHPAPGSQGRPSFTALVGSVDSDTSKYVAECRVQTGRLEMIQDLQEMAERVLNLYKNYRTGKEKKPFNLRRIIFYRDGVSEGEFRKVIEQGEFRVISSHEFAFSKSCRTAAVEGYAIFLKVVVDASTLTLLAN